MKYFGEVMAILCAALFFSIAFTPEKAGHTFGSFVAAYRAALGE